MACFAPLDAWQTDSGAIIFVERGAILRKLTLPCGQCIGCRLERSRQWAIRCVHESQLHDSSSFVTLTYSVEFVPPDGSLDYRHFQLFMKRLRKHFGTRVRFYMCGEYGDDFGRPHFHACLFGCFFSDRVLFKELDSGSKIYTSKSLESLWPYGFSSVGDVTFESAAYVARYCTKKITGPGAADHYQRFDKFTGEVYTIVPEFNHMSLKPGIGFDWLRLYHPEVLANKGCVVGGSVMCIPKYYKKYLEGVDDYVDIVTDSYAKACLNSDDTTPARLAVRERVAHSRLSFKKRSLI